VSESRAPLPAALTGDAPKLPEIPASDASEVRLNAPIIALSRVTFAYPGREPALRGVDFALGPGQRVGIVGPNGAGKTTLALLAVGLLRPQSGEVLFRGRPVRAEKDFRPVRRVVGLLFQNADDQLFYPTVLEDVAFGPLNLGRSPAEAEAVARRTLEGLGLAGFEDRVTHRLSGGEKKLVSLATVLAMQPEALLLDEPTNALDAATRQRLIDILSGLPQALAIISHDLDLLARTTTEVLALEHGHLHREGPAAVHEHAHLHPHGGVPHTHGDEEG